MEATNLSRMISLRVSEEEYQLLKNYCRETGTRSLSEVARIGMKKVLNGHSRVDDIEARLKALEAKVDGQ